jgi:hypothetical protein
MVLFRYGHDCELKNFYRVAGLWTGIGARATMGWGLLKTKGIDVGGFGFCIRLQKGC